MFVSSPYPWHYTLRWPFYFTWPSTRNHTKLERTYDTKQFQSETNQVVRLLFCGDIMTLNQDTIPTLHPELCALIQSADYFIGNCEAVLGKHPINNQAKYRFTFHMPRAYLENIIQQTSLPPSQWLLSTANNHIGDIDMVALVENYDLLKVMGIKALGQYQAKQYPLYIIEKNNLRIGFAAWTEWMNREIFSANYPGVNRQQHVITHHWREIKAALDIDYLFGLPHWEYEFQHFPHKKTQQLAKHLIDDLGMDFIIGSHTHTLQPMEIFKHGLCLYNLGNFAGQGKAWSVKLNTLLEVKLQPSTVNPLASYQLHYFFQEHVNNKINIIPLHLAPLKQRNKLINLINKLYIMNG